MLIISYIYIDIINFINVIFFRFGDDYFGVDFVELVL